MRRLLLPIAVLCAAVLWPVAAGAQSATPSSAGTVAATPVAVIKVEGAIDRPLLGFLRDRLDQAVADGAVVVLELDTSGTIDQNGVTLADEVAHLPVPVVTWIGPVPAKASGAGLLLTYAASLSAVAPGSQAGPLQPIDLLHPDTAYPDLDATIDGWLAARHRQVDRSHKSKALTAQQALDYGFATETASSPLDLLNAIDGTEVMTPGGPVVLHTKIATTEQDVQEGTGVALRFEKPGPVRRVAHGVASPSMIYFLLVFGLACLAFELTQPGFGFAGFSGLFLVVLAVYGITVVPPSWLGLAVLLGGIGLLVLDVRLRRLGALSAAGSLMFVAGSFLVYGGVASAIRISPWLIGGATVATVLFYGFGLTVAIQSRDRILSTQRGLIGLVGEARGRMAPDGPVFVKGALWRGRSLSEPISSGTKVRVRGVEGLILKVEAEPGASDEDMLDIPEPLPAND